MDFETAYYIVNYFPKLLSENEAAALRHYNAMFKIGTSDQYGTKEQYEARIQWFRDRNSISDNPEVLSLLDNGLPQFYINAATRITKEKRDRVYFNNCPNCNKLARTPYARQCKSCGHSWHDSIGAEFKINKVFELQSQPGHLFFTGELKSGTVKEGMRIDLTFLGVAIKPFIKSVIFLDHTSERLPEMTLGVAIYDTNDIEYLKKRGVLAIPIIIDK